MRYILFWLLCALPLAAAQIHLSVSLRTAEDAPRAQQPVTVVAGDTRRELLTDREGNCRTVVPAGTAVITVGTSSYTLVTAEGAPNAFTLVEGWRQVTMKGVPASAVLHGSYAWRGTCRFLHAVADAQGSVRWPSMPPVPVVVWGDGMAAGVLAAKAVAVTAPLPAPREDTNVTLSFLFPDLTSRTPLSYCAGGGYPLSGAYHPDEVKAVGPEFGLKQQLRCGAPFSLLVLTKTAPPRIAWLDAVYAPIVDTPAPVALSLPMCEIATLHLRFTTTEHQPLAGVSRLDVLPADPAQLPDMLQGVTAHAFGFFTPQPEPGGFVVLTPVPGTYRLRVDCYDASVTLPPALEVDVAPGTSTQTVTLPPPLLQVPAGTAVTWVTRNAPSGARRLTALDAEGTVPIFGARAETLACWYAPDPEHLVVWKDGELRTFTRRSVLVTPVDAAGKARSGYFNLRALLPRPRADWGYFYQPTAGSEATHLPLQAGKPVTLWTAPYALTNITNGGSALLHTLTVPAGPEPQLTLSPVIPRYAGKPRPRIRWHFPHLDYPALSVTAAPAIAFLYDTPLAEMLARAATVSEKNLPQFTGKDGNVLPDLDLSFPASAKTVTFSWLGVGVIRDVPIPREDKPTIDITLPAWDRGATIHGEIRTVEGKPSAKEFYLAYTATHPFTEYAIETGMFATNVHFWTDEQGRFTLQGVPPGPLLIGSGDGGWAVEAPAQGVKTVELAKILHPLQMRLTALVNSMVWWIPDHGTPRRLYTYGNEIRAFDRPLTPGHLWALDGTGGEAYFVRYLPAEGGLLPKVLPDGPPLGLYLPLDDHLGLPDGVELIGLGARAGLHVYFSHLYWQPIPLLGACVGEIGAVPPGEYRVNISTYQGVLTTTATVTETGGQARFTVGR